MLQTTGINPYQPPADIELLPNAISGIERLISTTVTVIGFALAILASLGSLIRCLQELDSFQAWQSNNLLAGGEGLLAIFALAVATWLLLGLIGSIGRFVSRENTTFSKGLILIAIVAMFARLVTDPASAWTPHWPTYALTFTGVTALAMVLYRVKKTSTS